MKIKLYTCLGLIHLLFGIANSEEIDFFIEIAEKKIAGAGNKHPLKISLESIKNEVNKEKKLTLALSLANEWLVKSDLDSQKHDKSIIYHILKLTPLKSEDAGTNIVIEQLLDLKNKGFVTEIQILENKDIVFKIKHDKVGYISRISQKNYAICSIAVYYQ